MDPYGFLPDDLDSVLGVTTHFKEYCYKYMVDFKHGGGAWR